MRTVRQQGEARRDQIAQAVLGLVAEHGMSALSVAAVAHRVGVAPSALYRHFPSKDAMLAGTLERVATQMLGNLERARAGARDPLDALERLLTMQAELVRGNRGIPFVLFSESLQRSTEHRERLGGFMGRFLGALVAQVREAQDAGQVRRDLPAEALAVTFIGLYVPPAILWNMSGGRFDITGQVRRAWQVFRDGARPVSVPPTRPRPRARVARRRRSHE